MNLKLKKQLGLEHNSTTAHRYWRALIMEFVATGLFVFCAAGSVVAQSVYEVPTAASNLVAGIVQGFAIAALVYTSAPTSGGHINPAVTSALMISGDMPLLDGVGYVSFKQKRREGNKRSETEKGRREGDKETKEKNEELTRSRYLHNVLAASLVLLFFLVFFLGMVCQRRVEGTLGTTGLSNGTSIFQGYLFETVVTFLLIFTIYGSSVDKDNGNIIRSLAPIPIGFSVMAGVSIAFGFTGGSLNPARTLGPAVISHTWTNHYIYWLGPLTAALFAGLLHKFMLKSKPSKADEKKEIKENKANELNKESSQNNIQEEEVHSRDIEEGGSDVGYASN